MSDVTPEDIEFVRDYAERNADYAIVGPVVDFINHHLASTRIIRTVEELEALDPDTVVLDRDSTGGVYPVSQYLDSDECERGSTGDTSPPW